MDKKKVLSILLLIMVTFIVIIFAVTHPSTKANPPTESADQESTKETTTDSRPSVAEIIIDISTEVAEEDIAQFQGEWKDTESQYKKLLIAGSTVNDVFYGVIDNSGFKQFVDTFYFKYDENHQIVVCDEANQPKYILSIPEYGKLKMESVSDDFVRIYEYVSNNTNILLVALDPVIGMTAENLEQSTWGYPNNKNITETASHTKEQWVYDQGYIYLTDGIVTAIQKTE